MWPSPCQYFMWMDILRDWPGVICWLKVMAHPLFRQAVRGGRWNLDVGGRVDVAQHLGDLTRMGAPDEVVEARRAFYGGVRELWYFKVVRNSRLGHDGAGDPYGRTEYMFEFDARTTRLLQARQLK